MNAIDQARDEVGRAIAKYMSLAKPDAVVTAWVVGLEWSSVGLARDFRSDRHIISPLEQCISTDEGLGNWIGRRYKP